jgi:STAS-like domain of unknown function (DUF4325)
LPFDVDGDAVCASWVAPIAAQHLSDGDYSFDKTIVPVRLLSCGDDRLVSRSQAKRLLSRIDRFKVVVLDFAGVATVGQAFADEVFRVFRTKHPQVDLQTKNVSTAVRRMITRAEALRYLRTGPGVR